MRVFINYIANYGFTTDTDILYPKHLLKLKEYFDINSEVNKTFFQPYLLKFTRRIKRTRFNKYLQKIPSDIVFIPTLSVSKYDLVYSSYIYPKYIGFGKIPPNILRINWQTDHVLNYRGIKDIVNTRSQMVSRWSFFNAIVTTTKFSVPLIENLFEDKAKLVYYSPFFCQT
ncbi:hypothetical protein [Picosynechococcus sp. PCC 7117]|uniref:hypothetical protein n=1 Tax=Picosynechococcus sp. PCC 7117 TaxID=195498 RepID=UPI0012ECFDBE|nr:hypothetical protein [Picosynechococcus sp. PCC 7117]